MRRSVSLEDVIIALTDLGGEAQSSEIKDRIETNFGGVPTNYKSTTSFRETIQVIIQEHCPQEKKYKSKPIFQKLDRGRFRLTNLSLPMKHFVAYHNADKMRHSYEQSEGFGIFSSKPLKFLEGAIGETVWVINGAMVGSTKTYTLCAAFTPDQIVESDRDFKYLICGSSGRCFNPPIVLNGLSWFTRFLKSQTNFSLGINVILDDDAITGLSLLTGNAPPQLNFVPNDSDTFEAESREGNKSYVTHLRRERNRLLILAKKKQVMDQHGQLRCEACGFDFQSFYGEIGKGFCEVHHKIPLATVEGSRITNLSDLAVLCSNCHRVIHKTTPMLSVSDFNELIKELQSGAP